MHQEKYQNIIQLNDIERYNYLVRKVADFETIHLIYGKSWQMSTSNINGFECVLLFPEREFAEMYIKSDNSKVVKKRKLYKFIDWLEKDKSNEFNLAVFPNEHNEAKIVSSSKLKNDLQEECEQYK